LIQEHHLPDSFHLDEPADSFDKSLQSGGISLEEIEKQAILGALQRNKWKKMMTCRELGISKDTLRRKIERYNLDNPLDLA
ncbi:MAG: helix-turn-helix domain-containing protein, partial [Desulfocapsaceae bacterium]